MIREAVQSSNLASLGYDAEARKLEVAFRPDRTGYAAVWEYDDVPPEMEHRLLSAESIGREFAIIRYNFASRRVATITPDGVEHRAEVTSHE